MAPALWRGGRFACVGLHTPPQSGIVIYMETRTDPHSPTNLRTEDYEYVFAADTDGPWAVNLDRHFLADILGNYDPATADRGHNQCHHCGAHLRYVAWLRHVPTGYTICVGETCLENRFERATADFQRLRKAAKLDREAARVRQARKDFLTYLPEELEWLDNDEPHELVAWNDFVCDIQAKFHRYGKLSEKQVKAVLRVWEGSKRKAEQPEESEPNWVPAPLGRHEITGTVLTAQIRESDWGTVLKLLLRVDTDEGAYKVWMNCPSDLWVSHPTLGRVSPYNGDTLTVRVTLEADRNHAEDPSFVFGKRPKVIGGNLEGVPCLDARGHLYETCACHAAADDAA